MSDEMQSAYNRMQDVIAGASSRRSAWITTLDGVIDSMRAHLNSMSTATREMIQVAEVWAEVEDKIKDVLAAATAARDQMLGTEYDRERMRDV